MGENKTPWTPGPWIHAPAGAQMAKYSQSHGVASHDGKNLVAGCFADGRNGCKGAEANARLIAAAPEMVELLERLCDALASIECDRDDLTQDEAEAKIEARALLASIRGESA